MDSNNLLTDFDRETECEYKGRKYLVRDNGSILRLPKEGQRQSQYDNVWTFGTKDPRTGYMLLTGNIRVHQIVCTAFNGAEPEPNMVVDHIDTNRCNNRPENLRWLTRLENVLCNEATRKKVIYLCGSIEAFIENPAILREKALPPDISWMKTVTKEQAAACKKHIEEWAKADTKPNPNSKGIGNWIFEESDKGFGESWDKDWANREYKSDYKRQLEEIEKMNQRIHDEVYGLKDSLTPGAKQLEWKTPTEFLLCPERDAPRTLQTYLANLAIGKTFTRTQYGDGGKVRDYGYNDKEEAIFVLTEGGNTMKPWCLTKITTDGDVFIHSNEGSFFNEDGGQKYFTIAMGREWTGGDVFDDYC